MTYLTGEQAIEELASFELKGAELLGMDGLLVHPGGAVEGPIDLILDFTTRSTKMAATERYESARQFVIAHAAPNVRWEIVTA